MEKGFIAQSRFTVEREGFMSLNFAHGGFNEL